MALALAHWLPVLIAAIIVLAVVVILARWAPADLIIADAIGLTTADLAALTSVNFPLPAESRHTTQDIKVLVVPMDKTATQYKDRREYVSEDEESRYEIYFRYNRVA